MRVQRTRSSASPPHSPQMRWPLGLTKSLLVSGIALLLGCVARCVSTQGAPETAQAQCGVASGSGVSEEQAKCIAKSAGLPEGIKPWTAGVEPAQPGQKSARWVIYSIQRNLQCTDIGPAGTAVVIDMHDGRILTTYPFPGPVCGGA